MADVDRCIICGAPIPEGRQICLRCEKGEKMRMRIGDKLKDYSVGFRDHAHWIEDGGRLMIIQKYKCSNCGNRSAEKSNFCSFCGARMDEDADKQR